jgi:Asp-tRNA(Asn)/Glu-tRNA(Gln) amidotransferase A subunit family amidase
MARNIAARQISSVELMTAHLNQIQQINPRLNAVVELLSQPALLEASKPTKS